MPHTNQFCSFEHAAVLSNINRLLFNAFVNDFKSHVNKENEY